MHLGMSGRFLVAHGRQGNTPGRVPPRPARLAPTTMWRSSFSNGATRHLQRCPPLRLHGSGAPRRDRDQPHFAGMGIEPLGNEFSGEAIARLFAGKRTPLKAALLDQRLIAGLGNIYVWEALFRAGLHPEAAAGSLVTASGRRPRGPSAGRGDPRRAQRGGRGRRVDPARPRAGRTARSAISSTASGSTTGRASPA